MLKKWLPSLIGLSLFAMTGRLLGFVREILMAAKFGATETTDAYLTSLIIFDIAVAANTSVIAGTLSHLGGNLHGSNLHRLYKSGLKIFGIFFAASLILFPAFNFSIPLIFERSGEVQSIIVYSLQLFLFLSVFLIVSGIFSALLQANGNVTNPGRLIIFLNVFSVASLLAFGGVFGILSIPAGLLAGGLLFFIYQIFLIKKLTNENKTEQIEAAGYSMLPWLVSILLIFGNLLMPSVSGLVERYFAYSFTEGTFSHYLYSQKIMMLPLTILSYAISFSLLPFQTKLAAEKNMKEFFRVTNNGIIISILTSCLFALIFFALSGEIVRIIYEHGSFHAHDRVETSYALQIISLGMIPFLITPVTANIFYSFKRIKVLILINLFFVVLQFFTLTFFAKNYSGIEALTFSWVTVTWLNTITQFVYLFVKRKILFEKEDVYRIAGVLLLTLLLIIFTENVFSGEQNIDTALPEVLLSFVLKAGTLTIIFSSFVSALFFKRIKNIFSSIKKLRKTENSR
ncbi:MAG: hypothetical protein HYS25_07645 [Ignavibacteriales bacterium]|nr:hypothetical protein [Ignavibacteriales bacterium]